MLGRFKTKIIFALLVIFLVIVPWQYGVKIHNEIIKKIYKTKDNIYQDVSQISRLNPEINFPIVSSDDQAKIMIVSHYTLDNNFIHNVITNHSNYAKKHGYDYWFRNGILDLSLLNLERRKYGMSFSWQKIVALQQAMDIKDQNDNYKYEWVMWIDGDAVFTNFSQTIKSLLEKSQIKPDQYLLIAKDMLCDSNNSCFEDACVNAGVFLIRNNDQGRLFVNTIRQSFTYYKDRVLVEQAAINDYIIGLLKLENNKIKIKSFHGENKCNLPTVPGVKIVPTNYMNSGYNIKLYREYLKFSYMLRIKSIWQAGDYILHFAGTTVGKREEYINNFLDCMAKNSQNLVMCEKPAS